MSEHTKNGLKHTLHHVEVLVTAWSAIRLWALMWASRSAGCGGRSRRGFIPKTRDVKRCCGLQTVTRPLVAARFVFQNLSFSRAAFCRAQRDPSPGFNNNAILIEVEHIKSTAVSLWSFHGCKVPTSSDQHPGAAVHRRRAGATTSGC
jgi:hypothetical protein